MVFPALQSEIDVLKDEVTPPGITKKDFERVIEYATDGRYDFLYINRVAEPGKRVRKNLDEVIDLAKFGARTYTGQEDEQDVLSSGRSTKGPGTATKDGGRRQASESGHSGPRTERLKHAGDTRQVL